MPSSVKLLSSISPPKQARSEETARRILDAAQALIERDGLSGLSIPAVVRRARSSTGSFYARFEDKNALLAALEERFFQEVHRVLDELAGPERWRGHPTRELVEACVSEMLRRLRQHARLVCAFAFRSAHEATFATRVRRFHERLTDRMRALFLARRGEMTHPEPEIAVALALEFAFTFIQTRILFAGQESARSAIGDDQLARELTRMFLAYAGIAFE
ncbi:MAG TPA: TetR/AcrR family transcriptional regulator [Myxococcota bacterium]|nr:TetR/AcrR family transcriptional regulator [Myxococcota bacterium]